MGNYSYLFTYTHQGGQGSSNENGYRIIYFFTWGKMQRSEARKACVYILHRQYEIPVIKIVPYFKISSPAVSTMVAEGEKLLKNDIAIN